MWNCCASSLAMAKLQAWKKWDGKEENVSVIWMISFCLLHISPRVTKNKSRFAAKIDESSTGSCTKLGKEIGGRRQKRKQWLKEYQIYLSKNLYYPYDDGTVLLLFASYL